MPKDEPVTRLNAFCHFGAGNGDFPASKATIAPPIKKCRFEKKNLGRKVVTLVRQLLLTSAE